MSEFNPGLVLIVGALLLPLVPRAVRPWVSMALPIAAGALLAQMPLGTTSTLALFDIGLTPTRIDGLSFAFGLVFLLAAFIASVFTAHDRGWLQPVAGHIYAGSAVGAVFAGDLITLFVFWEITAIASVFLIWARGTKRAFDTGMRYLVVQIGSGVILLAGVLIHFHATGSIGFDQIAQISVAAPGDAALGAWLIFLAFGIKAAFPLLHNWLHDAYPEATPEGAVWLSAFTTKLAIYALARGFAGSDIMIPIGMVMIVFTLFYALAANDMRRVLTYAINNQLGFMVVAIGIGSALAINGAVAQAFVHVLYKGLLFMVMGAVLVQTGTARATDLGGLARAMPWTAAFCVAGALAVSFPLFGGYVAKSLITSAASDAGASVAWVVLSVGSAGIFLVCSIKVPYAVFFAPAGPVARGEAIAPLPGAVLSHSASAATTAASVQDPPVNMRVAMGLAAALCLVIGLLPSQLYAILPNAIEYSPYKVSKIIAQLQLLAFAALAFVLALRWQLYPIEGRVILLDTDWLYRRFGYHFASTLMMLGRDMWKAIAGAAAAAVEQAERSIGRTHNPDGILGRPWSTGLMAFWTTALLAGYLLLFYLRELPG